MTTPPNQAGQTWTTQELMRDFTVVGFSLGICVVERKSDGVRGTLDFDHSPRVYRDFRPDTIARSEA